MVDISEKEDQLPEEDLGPAWQMIQKESDQIEAQRKEAKRKMYQHMMQRLSKACQEIIKAYLEGYSMEEIAEIRNLKNAKTASQTYYNCKNQLKKLIQANP